VSAAGRPPLGFQWQIGGSNIPGATNASLSLVNVQASDTGDYSVVVSDKDRSVTSRVAHFTVMTPAAESLDARNLRWTLSGDASWYGQSEISHDGVGAAQSGPINDAQKTSIQTTVSGPGWLSFWWKVSSEQWFDFLTFTLDGVQQGSISGEVDWQQEFFPIPSGTHVLNWTYSKDASGNGGLDAGWVDQVAFGPGSPIITQQPLSQTVTGGANVNLSVSGSGAPPLAYQWLKNGSNVDGATLPLLSIQNVSRHNSGSYEVIVSNSLGANTSSTALVRVRVPESLNRPQWLPNGSFAFVAADSDRGALSQDDLAGFVAQISTNLIDWDVLNQPLSLTNGTILLIDPQSTNYASRFYRILER
jgi:hypothetical protein